MTQTSAAAPSGEHVAAMRAAATQEQRWKLSAVCSRGRRAGAPTPLRAPR
jgi:hypothetical protein